MPRGRSRRATSPETTTALAPRPAPRRPARGVADFSQALVLNQWLFSLFGLESEDGFVRAGGRATPLLEEFKRRFQINEHSEEGLVADNVHRFHHALVNQTTGELAGITKAQLLEFDQNIVRHTLALNEQRVRQCEERIVWKYFQYLSLLFVEIYLDRFFRDPQALAQSINGQIVRYNAAQDESSRLPLLSEDRDAALGLNKLALWCATGSGKTLLMHMNLRQFQFYQARAGKASELNRILLLTPNDGLSRQHLREFNAAGIEAELFDKDSRGLFTGSSVEIIDVNKLADESGDKTVATDAFESNNLVLVDEGHRGAAGGAEGKWLSRRDQLCEKGFSFEYSATFKQAVKGDPTLTERYARSIVFDYSYKYFHRDGYGKDYQILNLDDATQQAQRHQYLTACLLAAYQQTRLFDDQAIALRPFNIERPLWVFVGSSVNAVRTEGGAQVSDVTDILGFLSRFVSERRESERTIEQVVRQGLVTRDGTNLFANRFRYLAELGLDGAALYQDICARLFNAPGGGALHVDLLKGTDGELALRFGDNDPFGLINVGDAPKLHILCGGTPGLVAEEKDFSGSLFDSLDRPGSRIGLVIGSRRFTEGWNSWRVSTLGLMNMGRSEGAQIIQLFGRGVRLKGYGFSLMRSKALQRAPTVPKPAHISVLETLSVFGIRADYMQRFREYLIDEGLPDDTAHEEILLPVIKNLGAAPKLKVIRLKPEVDGVKTQFGAAFRKLAPVPELLPPESEKDLWLLRNKVQLNWYPKVQAIQAGSVPEAAGSDNLFHGKLTPRHIAPLDLDRAWFELVRFKNERGWHNFNIPRSAVECLLATDVWYDLLIPKEQLAFDSMDRVPVWQEIAESLLKQYAERYYAHRKKEWEAPHLEYAELTPDDANFPVPGEGVSDPEGVYRILVEKSEEQLIVQLKALVEQFRMDRTQTTFPALSGARGTLRIFRFGQHLYEPLVHASGASIQVKPVALNDGEYRFVEDLKAYCLAHPAEFADRPLYLMRNQGRGRGIGFFEAGNFYPDFILWRINDEKQRISFVDPKGIRHLSWANEPKLEFHQTIKGIEQQLGDSSVSLDSFIVSSTSSSEMALHWGVAAPLMRARNILFQEDSEYIRQLVT